MATEIKNPYNIFFDDDGLPLESGYIFIGVSGLNPLANPQQAYWDNALTIPAAAIRTSGGFPIHNGAVGRLFVPGDYSILVQDKNGKTVWSQLEVTFEYADLLLTELRGTLSRSARAPTGFDCDAILESGLYAWTNGTTTNQPASCAAGDLFMLAVTASPDGAGGGLVLQVITDLTEGTTGANAEFRFARYSTDAGATWSTWVVDWVGPFGEAQPGNKIFTSNELNRDLFVILDNALAAAIDITAGTARIGTRITFLQTGAGVATITWAAGLTVVLVRYTVQEFIWDGTGWCSPAVNHGRKVFGPGALAATLWYVPPGIRKMWVTAAGQGGSGFAATSGTRSGGGGGSGAWSRALELDVIPGTPYTITLATGAASTLVGGVHNISYGRGSDAVNNNGGAAGVGAGGASSGYAGGAGTAGAGARAGGGGGGVGGVGGGGSTVESGAGGGSGGAAVGTFAGVAGVGPFLNGAGGGSNGTNASSAPGPGGGGGGGGTNIAATISVIPAAAGCLGGGGGGGSTDGAGNVTALGVGGAPFLVIEW